MAIDLKPGAIPSRSEQLQRLQEGEIFDLLVIGGGATGVGIALDAATRGLKVALVEREDFSAGTSSRSTKLIHGGVRYLEQAVKGLDRAQYDLVVEALHERATMIKNAPHLARAIRLLTPLYRWWELPYYWIGLKVYDLLAGRRSVGRSHYIGKKRTLQRFPGLREEGLKGAVVYYDGQFDDARYNVTLALTAASYGAAVVNHVEVEGLIKEKGKLVGADLHDTLSDCRWKIRAKAVINATGPYVDAMRILDDPNMSALIAPSIGTHLILDKSLAPQSTGLLVPKTADGRVLFLLPWEGATLVGTTDESAPLSRDPKPSEKEILYILAHLQPYFKQRLRLRDVRSAWSGLRPLVKTGAVGTTSKLVRDHHLEVSSSGLVTIAGGKWTTYRKMAEDVVDCAITSAQLHPVRDCSTQNCLLVGARSYHHADWQQWVEKGDVEEDIARHLSRAYGDCAGEVVALMRQGFAKRLAEGYPFVEAEVVYAVQKEYACTPADILLRRTRLSTLDQKAGEQALNRVILLMAQQLAWDRVLQQRLKAEAISWIC